MTVICKECGATYKVQCHVCFPPNYIQELEDIALETATYRFKNESYQNLASAIHSVLMELGLQMTKYMQTKLKLENYHG